MPPTPVTTLLMGSATVVRRYKGLGLLLVIAVTVILAAARLLRTVVLMHPLRALLLPAALYGLPLLNGLGHRIEDTKIVLSILEIALCHHPIATAGGIATKLEIFLEQLLRRAANSQVWAAAVEHMIAV